MIKITYEPDKPPYSVGEILSEALIVGWLSFPAVIGFAFLLTEVWP